MRKNTLFVSFALFALTLSTLINTSQAMDITVDDSLKFTGCENFSKEASQYTYSSDCLEEFSKNHPFKRASFKAWQDTIGLPVGERIVSANEEIIQFLQVDSALFGFPTDFSASSDTDLVNSIQEVLENMPDSLKVYLEDNFYGITFVEHSGWTGFAPSVEGDDNIGLSTGAAIVINTRNFKYPDSDIFRTMNSWLTWKETTAVANVSDGDKFHMSIEQNNYDGISTPEDNLKQFFYHELAHLAAATLEAEGTPVHPPVPRGPDAFFDPDYDIADFPFTATSWEIKDTKEHGPILWRKASEKVNTVNGPGRIGFYKQDESDKKSLEDMIEVYNDLNDTCFVSFYATSDHVEDFAETLTQFLLLEEGYDEYSLTIRDSYGWGDAVAHFQNNIFAKPECSEKADYITNIFGQ